MAAPKCLDFAYAASRPRPFVELWTDYQDKEKHTIHPFAVVRYPEYATWPEVKGRQTPEDAHNCWLIETGGIKTTALREVRRD